MIKGIYIRQCNKEKKHKIERNIRKMNQEAQWGKGGSIPLPFYLQCIADAE